MRIIVQLRPRTSGYDVWMLVENAGIEDPMENMD